MNDRDEFAKAVLIGICANPRFDEEGFDETAMTAYLQADAMLAARGEQDKITGVTHDDLCACEAAWVSKLVTAESEIAALKVELARWKEPLTDDERSRVWYLIQEEERHEMPVGGYIGAADRAISAIREVRGK